MYNPVHVVHVRTCNKAEEIEQSLLYYSQRVYHLWPHPVPSCWLDAVCEHVHTNFPVQLQGWSSTARSVIAMTWYNPEAAHKVHMCTCTACVAMCTSEYVSKMRRSCTTVNSTRRGKGCNTGLLCCILCALGIDACCGVYPTKYTPLSNETAITFHSTTANPNSEWYISEEALPHGSHPHFHVLPPRTWKHINTCIYLDDSIGKRCEW